MTGVADRRSAAEAVEVGAEQTLRRQLAAAFRWTARLGWHEGVANHFSAVVADHPTEFLLNPVGRHFSRITAGSLARLSVDAAPATVVALADPTAWCLHGSIHRRVPRARVVLHTHMPYATTIACLDGYEFQMLDQNACRFHRRIAHDRAYGGMLLGDAEGDRLAALIGDDHDVVLLGNHGVLVVGDTVAAAFDTMYHLERAAMVQVLALSTGRPLAILDEDVAARTRRQWAEYPGGADLHFTELLAILDASDPSYAD